MVPKNVGPPQFVSNVSRFWKGRGLWCHAFLLLWSTDPLLIGMCCTTRTLCLGMFFGVGHRPLEELFSIAFPQSWVGFGPAEYLV